MARRRGSRSTLYAVAGALVLVSLPGVASSATQTAPVDRTVRDPAGARRTTALRTASAPAYLGTRRLTALLPGGGRVAYRLPTLTPGGSRLLGDWDGDGAETPATFAAGVWQLSGQVVRPHGTPRTVTFGRAGDRPVAGDWNGDGLTDLGVVRGNEWLLTLAPVPTSADAAAPVVWRDVTFGSAGGVPVTGDWNGDGVTGLGMVAGRSWLLAPSVDRLGSATTVSFGRHGDTPVTGDWNGLGRDGIGVVRRATWFLSTGALRPRADVVTTVQRSPGDVPVPWRVPEVPGTTTCPTRRPTARRGNPHWVVPSTALDRAVTPLPDRTTRQVRTALESAERYLLGAQYDALWRSTAGRPYLGLLRDKGDELAIRLPAMSALTVAVGLRTGAADPVRTGRSTQRATAYVDQLVRSIACQHVAVSPDGWGRGWETAHWAMLTGAAAWLVWDRLSPQTRSDVVTMMVAEADRQARLAIPYWASADGTVLTPGDTKAEECAWNAGLLSLAAAMMPSAPHAARWRAQAAELAVAAYAVPSDVTSSVVVNGVPLAARVQGYNAYADGTVENHQRIHPDYAANVQLLWLAADFDRLARQRAPEALFHDGGLVYSALSTRRFEPGTQSPAGGTFLAPGGTTYVVGSNAVYYPQGDDWGVVRRAHFVNLDAHALVYGAYLHATGWPAGQALSQHVRGQLALMATSGGTDGRTYSVDPAVAARQDTYPGREEYAAQSLAAAWLALYVRTIGVPRLDRGALPVPVTTTRAPRAPAAAATLAP
jgi:hypothetical protein